MTTRLTYLVRILGVTLLAMLLLATPAIAQDNDDDDDDGHQHSSETMTDDDNEDDDDDRDATGTGATGSDDDRFGAFIRAGVCDTPGDVVEEIDELEHDDADDDDEWQKLGGDEPRPDALYSAEEDIDQTIDELAGGEFVVTVHDGKSADSAVIACGAISGDVDADGTLLVDLAEVDDSGFEGRAHFGPDTDDDNDDDSDDDDGDDDQTEVTVNIWAAFDLRAATDTGRLARAARCRVVHRPGSCYQQYTIVAG